MRACYIKASVIYEMYDIKIVNTSQCVSCRNNCKPDQHDESYKSSHIWILRWNFCFTFTVGYVVSAMAEC